MHGGGCGRGEHAVHGDTGMLLALGFSAEQMGVFLGASIHDVAQVFGAGDMISPTVAQLATYTKMLRVAMLLPAIVVLAVIFPKGGETNRVGRMLPPFLIAFLGFVILANSHLLSETVIDIFSDFSRIFLRAAMAALGAKSNLVELWHVGGKPLVLLLINTFFVAGISMLMVLANKVAAQLWSTNLQAAPLPEIQIVS